MRNKIIKAIKDHKESLEELTQYRDMEVGIQEKDATIADIIMSCDWEGDDFDMGFEQGYIRGMEVILNLCPSEST